MIISAIDSGFILSIGSGTGLLEALLNEHFIQARPHQVSVEGVEVASQSASLNHYLPEELTNVVDGTWALSSRAECASGLMFVYPRAPDLVERYLKASTLSGGSVDIIIWLGPKIDWIDFVDLFHADGFGPITIIDECGLAGYELMAFTKRIV